MRNSSLFTLYYRQLVSRRAYSNYWTTQDLAYRHGKGIQDRIYFGSLEQNIPQKMLEEYESMTSLKDKVAFKVKTAGQRLIAYVYMLFLFIFLPS